MTNSSERSQAPVPSNTLVQYLRICADLAETRGSEQDGLAYVAPIKLREAITEIERLTRERQGWVDTAAEFARNMEYYQRLMDRIGRAIGREAYTADDGSVSQDVLRAKVPEIIERVLSERTQSPSETSQKPTDSELYGSSELFRHVWFCPMGWVGDKLIYGPGYTSADMKQWLIGLRRLVGFNTPEGVPLESPPKASGEPTDAEKRAMGVDLDSRDHEAR